MRPPPRPALPAGSTIESYHQNIRNRGRGGRVRAMNRRQFLPAAVAPLFVPRRAFGANSRIQVGLIGFGGRARFLMEYIGREVDEAELVAVADCYLPRTEGKDPGGAGTPLSEQSSRWAKYQDFRKMLDKQKLDAVFVETTC